MFKFGLKIAQLCKKKKLKTKMKVFKKYILLQFTIKYEG
jgi:hypothetical protein